MSLTWIIVNVMFSQSETSCLNILSFNLNVLSFMNVSAYVHADLPLYGKGRCDCFVCSLVQ